MNNYKLLTAAVMNRPDATKPYFFHLYSVEKIDAPSTEQGNDWFCYVLKSDNSTITGVRRGTHQHVHDYATEYAEQLNLRVKTGPSTWNPRGRKPGRPPSN